MSKRLRNGRYNVHYLGLMEIAVTPRFLCQWGLDFVHTMTRSRTTSYHVQILLKKFFLPGAVSHRKVSFTTEYSTVYSTG